MITKYNNNVRRRKNNNHKIPLWTKDWSISSSGQHGASIITLGTLIIWITKITVILFKEKPIIFGYFYSLILPVFNWTCLQGPSPNMGLRPWLMTPVPPGPHPPENPACYNLFLGNTKSLKKQINLTIPSTKTKKVKIISK